MLIIIVIVVIALVLIIPGKKKSNQNDVSHESKTTKVKIGIFTVIGHYIRKIFGGK